MENMINCLNCESPLKIERLRCSACGLAYDGRFELPRLARLTPAEQKLVEDIVLATGNLKQVAQGLDISYPTLRKRVDALVRSLQELASEDRVRCESLLDEVEARRSTPEEAARLIKELNGGQ